MSMRPWCNFHQSLASYRRKIKTYSLYSSFHITYSSHEKTYLSPHASRHIPLEYGVCIASIFLHEYRNQYDGRDHHHECCVFSGKQFFLGTAYIHLQTTLLSWRGVYSHHSCISETMSIVHTRAHGTGAFLFAWGIKYKNWWTPDCHNNSL